MTKYDKIQRFLRNADGRSYTSKSLSKVLNIDWETTRKYLREGYYDGSLKRLWSRGTKKERPAYRYFV